MTVDYLALARQIGEQIHAYLMERLRAGGYSGETMEDPDDLKSTHAIDRATAAIAQACLADYDCNLFIESVDVGGASEAAFSVYIDPVDGSLNWERGVGDPCIVIAFADKPVIETLDELCFTYVRGLRSGDSYYADREAAYYCNALTGNRVRINPAAARPLVEATLYLRPGYGLARNQLVATLPLYLRARDIRAIDNAGIEVCEIARGAADLMVEARNGSDFFNLLAWPILRASGGVLLDLQGEDLTDRRIDFSGVYNYIASHSGSLAEEVVVVMQAIDSERLLAALDAPLQTGLA